MELQTECRPEADAAQTAETDAQAPEQTVHPLWSDRKTLCRALGIDWPTFYSRLRAGLIEAKSGKNGPVFRVVRPGTIDGTEVVDAQEVMGAVIVLKT